VQKERAKEVSVIMRPVRVVVLIFILLATTPISAQEDVVSRSQRYEGLIARAAVKYRVDPKLLWTIGYLETRFQHYDSQGRVITSRAGARGVMQFMPGTAAKYGWRDLDDPGQAIDAAARHVRDLMKRFGPRLDLILASYNAGETAVNAYRTGRTLILSNGKTINPRGIRTEIPPYRETNGYVLSGKRVYSKLSAAAYFSTPPLARLQISTTQEERRPTVILVDLEEEDMPQELIGLKKGNVYVIKEKPSSEAPTPKKHTSSIYFQ
jgi:Transglycosylase SLT domain